MSDAAKMNWLRASAAAWCARISGRGGEQGGAGGSVSWFASIGCRVPTLLHLIEAGLV